MIVMMVRPRPERNPVRQRPREIVARMSFDCLPEAKADPNEHGDDVEVGDQAQHHGAKECSCSKDKDLKRVCIFSRQTHRCLIFMMLFVNVFVEKRSVE